MLKSMSRGAWAVALAVVACPFARVSAGTWQWTGQGSDDNWSDGQNWIPMSAPANDGSADIIVTGESGGTLNIDMPWSIDSLTFNSQAYHFTVGGSTLTLGAGGMTNQVNSNIAQTITAPIVLGASQTWNTGTRTGTYILDENTLNTNGFGLTVAGSGGNSEGGGLLNSTVSGSGSLTVNLTNDAALASYGTNSYTGGTVLEAGELFIEQDYSLGSVTGRLTFNGGLLGVGAATTISRPIQVDAGGGTIYAPISQGTYLTISSPISGPGSMSFSGGEIQLTSTSSSYSGGTYVNGYGNLLVTTNTLQGNVSMENMYDTLAFEQPFNGTYGGNISGGGEVTIEGSGIVSFTGNNTYTSDTQLYSGVLEVSLNGNGLSPNSRLDFFGESTQPGGPILQVVGGGTFERSMSHVNFSGTGGFAARNGELFVNLGGSAAQFTLVPFDNLVFGSPTANSPTEFQNPIYLGSSETDPAPVVEVDSGAGGDYAILSGVISGGNYFAKNGDGLLILSATNTYSGPTLVNSGSLVVSGALAKTAVTVSAGASIGGTGSIAGSITVNGGSSSTGGGAINLVDGAPGVLTLSDPLASDKVLTLGGAAGSAAVVDMEVGTVSDEVLISAGELAVNAGGAKIYITALPGFGAGTYNLFSFPAGQATGLANLTLGQTSVNGDPLVLQATSTAEELIVVPEPGALLTAVAVGGLFARPRGRLRK
jgi:autotransporter-associated beta strand protein